MRLGVGIGLGVGGSVSAIIRSVVFSTLGAASLPSGMFFSRASVGRVKTGAGTRANLTSGQAGIGLSLQHGYTGLVHEASSTFLLKNSAQPGGTSWSTTGFGTVASDGPAPPEGGTTTQHLSVSSGHDGTYQTGAAASSSKYTVQAWLRPHGGTPSPVQFAPVMSPSGVGTSIAFSGWVEVDDWRHYYGTFSTDATASQNGVYKFTGADWSTLTNGPDNGIVAQAQNLDVAEVGMEQKPYPTSMITTPSAGTATRAASFFGFSSAAAQLDSTGRLTLKLSIVPHGKHADYTADFYLWYVDASNYAKVTASTRILTVVIGGSTVYTADTALAWYQGRPLDIFLAVGGGAATKFGWQKWGSGWTMAGDGATVAALGFGAVSLYLLSGSTDSTHFDCVVHSVVVGKTRYNPATNTTVKNAISACFAGNSITAGTGAASTLGRWAEQAKRRLGEAFSVDYSGAVVGQTTGDITTNYATQIAAHYDANAKKNILVVWEVTNDLKNYLVNNGITAADADVSAAVTYVTGRLQSLCEQARGDGWSVVVVDVIARGQLSAGADVPNSFEPARVLVNAWIASNWSTFADRFAQLGNHAKLGNVDTTSDTHWFADDVHPRNLGCNVCARTIVPEIEALAA